MAPEPWVEEWLEAAEDRIRHLLSFSWESTPWRWRWRYTASHTTWYDHEIELNSVWVRMFCLSRKRMGIVYTGPRSFWRWLWTPTAMFSNGWAYPEPLGASAEWTYRDASHSSSATSGSV